MVNKSNIARRTRFRKQKDLYNILNGEGERERAMHKGRARKRVVLNGYKGMTATQLDPD